jgi:hypothetical protein
MAKILDVYAVTDQALDAISFIEQSLSRAKPPTKVMAAIDAYTHCQKWLLDNGHQSTFIDLRMRAEKLISHRELLKTVPYDEQTWAYYLAHMPAYSTAMDTLISENHDLNAMVVQAVARDECKTDPYVMPAFCALLLQHRDWRSWQSYIADRRNNDASKKPALTSLHALHPEDLPNLLPFLADFLEDHPWKEKVLYMDISDLRRKSITSIFNAVISAGHPEIADNLLMCYRWDDLPLDYLNYFVKYRPQVLNAEWRMEAIQNANTNYKRGNLEDMPSYMVLAYAAFCGLGKAEDSVTQLSQNCNVDTQLKLLGGIAKMRRDFPDMYAKANLDAVSLVVEQCLTRIDFNQDEIKEILCESYQIEEDFYINSNAYKRIKLGEDLAL